MTDLKELRKIAMAATPGPWTWDGEDEPNAMIAKSPKHGNWKVEIITTDSGVYGPEAEDRVHIAAFSPDTALALLDELERLQAEITRQLDARQPSLPPAPALGSSDASPRRLS